MAITFNRETRFLFVGDSITDSGRADDPEGVGLGYVRLVRDYIRAKHPQTAPLVLNRARPGEQIADLKARWEQDVVAERPDLVSILIGTTDPLATGPREPGHSIDEFRAIYRQILEQTRARLPRCKLVLCEPTALWSRAPVQGDDLLRPYVSALVEMGREYGASAVVPLHAAFVWARRVRPEVAWVAADGRPTSSGHMLIASTWLEETEISPRLVS